MTETQYAPQTEREEDEIDLIAIAKTLWNGRKIIIWSAVIGLVVGVAVAFLTPKQYTVTSVIVPQYSGKSSGSGLSALASMAGINIGSAGDASGEISPLLYPQIVSSVPFQLELMNTPIHFSKVDHPVSLYEYYTVWEKPTVLATIKKYTLGLPGMIISAIRPKKDSLIIPTDATGPKVIALTEKQDKIYQFLAKSVSLEANAKEGYLTLSTTLNEPLATAELGQIAQDLLQQFVIDFKTSKSKAELDFIQERYNEVKAQAEGYQINIAQNTDKYKNLTSSVPQVQNTRVQTKYGVANTVYTELAKQLEQAKIQVKKDTPTFTVVQPVTIPIEPTGSGKAIKVLISIFLFVFIGIAIIFIRNQYPIIKEKFKAN